MRDQINQKDFHRAIMLVALAMCFESDEEYLSEEQLFIRGFSPIESYTKSCIAKLIDSGSVEFKTIEPVFPFGATENILCVKRPIGADHLDHFVCQKSEQIIELLCQSSDCCLYLRTLIQELLACECIEYAEYYASKANLKVVSQIESNTKLKLLIMENSIEKINSLLWRSIKTISTKYSDEPRSINLAEIVDVAFEIYVRCRKSNIQIEGYQRPSHFKPSILSGLLALYRGDLF